MLNVMIGYNFSNATFSLSVGNLYGNYSTRLKIADDIAPYAGGKLDRDDVIQLRDFLTEMLNNDERMQQEQQDGSQM